MVFENVRVKEELLGMICLKGKTSHQEICNYFDAFATKSNAILQKLVSINTDGTKSMTSQVNGFIVHCRQHDDLPDFLSYHCIIHQQVLASKRLNTKIIKDIALNFLNSIRGKSLQRRLFNITTEEGTRDIILITGVRWLSRFKFFKKFRTLLSEMRKKS
jgi:hypothetical protein